MSTNQNITKKEKQDYIRQRLSDLYPQMKINEWKCFGYSQAAADKWGGDLIPYIYETFLKMNVDKQYEIATEGNLEYYLTRAMSLSIKSSTSMFYHTYRKFSRKSDEVSLNHHDKPFESTWELREQQIDKVKEAIQDLNYYDKYLISQYYIEGNTSKHIAKITGISAATVGKSLKKALKRLKILLEDKYNIEF